MAGVLLWACQAGRKVAPPRTEFAPIVASAAPPHLQSNIPELRAVATPTESTSDKPRIFVKNCFLVNQYVFVDGAFVGEVLPSKEILLEPTPGTHVVLVSDSPDGKSNQQHIAEIYDAGFEYRYDVVAR
jgi:hypothetical protein